MVRAKATGALALTVLGLFLWADGLRAAFVPQAAHGYASSFCYDFTITPNSQPWCAVQGQVNGNTFLHFTCRSQRAEPIGPLGLRVNATGAWRGLEGTLQDLTEELKKQLLDMKPQMVTATDSFSLQVRMSCQREAHGRTSGFWKFGFDGKTFLCFDPKNRTYTVDHPGGKMMKEKWEHNKELTKTFTNVPLGDCGEWRDTFWNLWERELWTTASPTRNSAAAHPRNTWILFLPFVFCEFIFCVF